MKTGWTSLGSAARCLQGRGGWSRDLISCFLHHARSGLRSPLSLSRSISPKNATEERIEHGRRTVTEGTNDGRGQKKGTRPAFPAAVRIPIAIVDLNVY